MTVRMTALTAPPATDAVMMGARGTCLRSGRLDLTRTGERAVNLTHVGC